MREFRPAYITVSRKVHPFVQKLYIEMKKQRVGLTDLAARAGLSPYSISRWKGIHTPQLVQIEACLSVMGYELKVQKINVKKHKGASQSASIG